MKPEVPFDGYVFKRNLSVIIMDRLVRLIDSRNERKRIKLGGGNLEIRLISPSLI